MLIFENIFFKAINVRVCIIRTPYMHWPRYSFLYWNIKLGNLAIKTRDFFRWRGEGTLNLIDSSTVSSKKIAQYSQSFVSKCKYLISRPKISIPLTATNPDTIFIKMATCIEFSTIPNQPWVNIVRSKKIIFQVL